jgi:hypothetical protein
VHVGEWFIPVGGIDLLAVSADFCLLILLHLLVTVCHLGFFSMSYCSFSLIFSSLYQPKRSPRSPPSWLLLDGMLFWSKMFAWFVFAFDMYPDWIYCIVCWFIWWSDAWFWYNDGVWHIPRVTMAPLTAGSFDKYIFTLNNIFYNWIKSN